MPLSRRLDRWDRVTQNESSDPNGGNMYYVTMQIPLPPFLFLVSCLTIGCNGVFAIKACMVYGGPSRPTSSMLHLYI